MIFYHGTDSATWQQIKNSGQLHGESTYLAVDKKEAACYGPIVLEVNYEPNQGNDNYQPGCWQTRVYVPIPLEKIVVYPFPIRPTKELVLSAIDNIKDGLPEENFNRHVYTLINWLRKEFDIRSTTLS